MRVRLTFVNGENAMATIEIDGTPITLKFGEEREVHIPSATKPLKDQSYHQKRIADAMETISRQVKQNSTDVDLLHNYGAKVRETLENQLSEEDVRRIIKEELMRSFMTNQDGNIHVKKSRVAELIHDVVLHDFDVKLKQQ